MINMCFSRNLMYSCSMLSRGPRMNEREVTCSFLLFVLYLPALPTYLDKVKSSIEEEKLLYDHSIPY